VQAFVTILLIGDFCIIISRMFLIGVAPPTPRVPQYNTHSEDHFGTSNEGQPEDHFGTEGV